MGAVGRFNKLNQPSCHFAKDGRLRAKPANGVFDPPTSWVPHVYIILRSSNTT